MPGEAVLENDFEQRFADVDQHLSACGMKSDERHAVYKLLAAILHLGNIEFVEDEKFGCQITNSTESSLQKASELLCFNSVELKKNLLTRSLELKITSSDIM